MLVWTISSGEEFERDRGVISKAAVFIKLFSVKLNCLSAVLNQSKTKQSENVTYLSGINGFDKIADGVGGWIAIPWGIWGITVRDGRIGAWVNF